MCLRLRMPEMRSLDETMASRTKSCPVATSRPQRLLAVKDQELLPSPLPLARSRGNFVWPPTSISPLPPILPELQTGQLPHSPRTSPCTERDSVIFEWRIFISNYVCMLPHKLNKLPTEVAVTPDEQEEITY